MEEDASKSQLSHHEDGHITPKFLSRLSKDVKGLGERVEDILKEMEKYKSFSEMTPECYDEKKSNLTSSLTELSRMQKALADQISSTVRYSAPIGVYIALSRDNTVLCVSKSEESESSFLLSSDSASESLTADLGKEKEEIIELQKKVAELDPKNTKMGEELDASKDKCWGIQVEKDRSKSQSSHHEDRHNFLVRLAKKVKEFQKRVEEILEETEQDGNFSEITAERYDEKKSTLTRHLTELSSMHKKLADEISTKAPEALLFSSDDLGNEEATVIALQKEVADLKNALSESNLKNKKLEEDLDGSDLKVTLSDEVIQGLKQQRSIQDSKQIELGKDIQSVRPSLDRAKKETQSYAKRIRGLQSELSLYEADIAERDNQIAELKKSNNQYTSELTKLKSTYETKENDWQTSVGNLRKELEEKSESVADLNKKLDTIRAEKCSQDELIQEQETRLLASSEDAQKVTNQLTEKMLELESEVKKQKEVISVRDEQKEEVIRQISSALEHYKSR